MRQGIAEGVVIIRSKETSSRDQREIEVEVVGDSSHSSTVLGLGLSLGLGVVVDHAMRLPPILSSEVLTKPFLHVCTLILSLLGKFGAALSIVKSDVEGNLSRLEAKYCSDPIKYSLLYSLVRAEVEAKTARASSSGTNAIVWLTRSMDFLLALFRNVLDHPDWSMSRACTHSYNTTLRKWHGWLAASSFMVGLKFVSDRKKFMEIIGGGSSDVKADIERFCTTFAPLLEQNHKFLASVGLDDPGI